MRALISVLIISQVIFGLTSAQKFNVLNQGGQPQQRNQFQTREEQQLSYGQQLPPKPHQDVANTPVLAPLPEVPVAPSYGQQLPLSIPKEVPQPAYGAQELPKESGSARMTKQKNKERISMDQRKPVSTGAYGMPMEAEPLPQQPSGQFPQQPLVQFPQQPLVQFPQQPSGQFPTQPLSQLPQRPSGQFPTQPLSQLPQRPSGQFPQQPLSQLPQRVEQPKLNLLVPTQLEQQLSNGPAFTPRPTNPLLQSLPSGEFEPLTACDANPCFNEAECMNLPNGGFRCTCPWGWTGKKCEICLTDCASNPCPSNKKCRAKYGGGFDCICPADRTGFNCEIQNDACSGSPCLNGGVCQVVDSSRYQCVCQKPFSGVNCEAQWSNPCSEEVLRESDVRQFLSPWNRTSYIICVDVDQWVEMPCSTGTFFDEKSGHCIPEGFEASICPDNYCQNDGECFTTEEGKLACKCRAGFTGEKCETDIDECALNGNACAGGVCVDQKNTYYCLCPRLDGLEGNLVGMDCRNTMQIPCSSETYDQESQFFQMISRDGDVYLQCIGLESFIVRKCANGLFWNQQEKTCTIEKPVDQSGICQSFPCKNAGTCVDLGGQFKCLCKTGYTGEKCEDMIDFCASNPCQNGGRCLSYAGGYTCVCPDKIIDDCCCHGVPNPCPTRAVARMLGGSRSYFPHLFLNRYFHCDFDGRAFVRVCPRGQKWNQDVLACIPDDFKFGSSDSQGTPQLDMAINQGGYGNVQKPISRIAQKPVTAAPKPTTAARLPLQLDSYGQPQQPRIIEQAKPVTAAPKPVTAARLPLQLDSYGQPQQPRIIEQAKPVTAAPLPTTAARVISPEPVMAYGRHGQNVVPQVMNSLSQQTREQKPENLMDSEDDGELNELEEREDGQNDQENQFELREVQPSEIEKALMQQKMMEEQLKMMTQNGMQPQANSRLAQNIMQPQNPMQQGQPRLPPNVMQSLPPNDRQSRMFQPQGFNQPQTRDSIPQQQGFIQPQTRDAIPQQQGFIQPQTRDLIPQQQQQGFIQPQTRDAIPQQQGFIQPQTRDAIPQQQQQGFMPQQQQRRNGGNNRFF